MLYFGGWKILSHHQLGPLLEAMREGEYRELADDVEQKLRNGTELKKSW